MSCRVTGAALGCDLAHSCVGHMAEDACDRHALVGGWQEGCAGTREGCICGCDPVHRRKTKTSSKVKGIERPEISSELALLSELGWMYSLFPESLLMTPALKGARTAGLGLPIPFLCIGPGSDERVRWTRIHFPSLVIRERQKGKKTSCWNLGVKMNSRVSQKTENSLAWWAMCPALHRT